MSKSKNIMGKTCCFAKSVIRKTQELFEVSQINVKMMQIKNKLERKYAVIGYCVYKKQKKDGLEELKSNIDNEKLVGVFKEIDKLEKELEHLERELQEIKKITKKNEECTLFSCNEACKGTCDENLKNSSTHECIKG